MAVFERYDPGAGVRGRSFGRVSQSRLAVTRSQGLELQSSFNGPGGATKESREFEVLYDRTAVCSS